MTLDQKINEMVCKHHEDRNQPTLAAIRRLNHEKALRALTFLHGAAGADMVQKAIDFVNEID